MPTKWKIVEINFDSRDCTIKISNKIKIFKLLKVYKVFIKFLEIIRFKIREFKN